MVNLLEIGKKKDLVIDGDVFWIHEHSDSSITQYGYKASIFANYTLDTDLNKQKNLDLRDLDWVKYKEIIITKEYIVYNWPKSILTKEKYSLD